MKNLLLTCLGACLLLPAIAIAQCEGISIHEDGLFVVIAHDADYNCAVFDLHHEVSLEGNVLSVTETATADAWADCYCPYFSEVVIGGLNPGDYTLVYAYGEWIEGEEPPVFTWCELPFTVTGAPLPDDPIMVQTSASGCGIATAVPDQPLAAPRSLTEVKALYD